MPFVSDGQGGFIFQEPQGAADLANWEAMQRGMGSGNPGASAAGMSLDVRALQRYLLSDGADANNVAAKLQMLTRASDPRLSTTARALLADQRGLAALQGSLTEQGQADALAAGDARMNESAVESQQAATLRRFGLGGGDALVALGGSPVGPRSSAGLEQPGQILNMAPAQPGNRTAEVGAAFVDNPANAQAVGSQAAREAGMGDRPAGGSAGGPQSTPAMTGEGLAAVGQGVFGGLLDLPGMLAGGQGQDGADDPGGVPLDGLQAQERAFADVAARDRQKALDAIAALENPYSNENMQRSQDAALLGMQVGQLGQDRAVYTSAAARGMGSGGQATAQGAALAGAQQAAQAMRSADIFDKYTVGRSDFEAQRANQSANILRDPTTANLALEALNRTRSDARFSQGLSRQEAEAEEARSRGNLDRILGIGGQLAGTALAGPIGGKVGEAAGQALGALGSWAFPGAPGDKNGAAGSSTSKSNEATQQGPTQGGMAIGGYQGTITPSQSMRGLTSSAPARYGVGWKPAR